MLLESIALLKKIVLVSKNGPDTEVNILESTEYPAKVFLPDIVSGRIVYIISDRI